MAALSLIIALGTLSDWLMDVFFRDILLHDAIATGKYYARVSMKIKTSDDDAHRWFQRCIRIQRLRLLRC